MPARRWPPPGFPLVEGDYALNAEWSVQLPKKFARRIEDGSLVLWRPGLTLWLAAWRNDRGEPNTARLASIKQAASPNRFDERQSEAGGVARFSYRLHDQNDDGPVDSLSAYIFNENGHLQIAVYFDDPADAETARRLVESVKERRQP